MAKNPGVMGSIPERHGTAEASLDRPILFERRSGHQVTHQGVFRPATHDETLVVEERLQLRPAQVVERKLTRLLQEVSLPVSHLQMRGLLRSR
jgi:hypothetical protein